MLFQEGVAILEIIMYLFNKVLFDQMGINWYLGIT